LLPHPEVGIFEFRAFQSRPVLAGAAEVLTYERDPKPGFRRLVIPLAFVVKAKSDVNGQLRVDLPRVLTPDGPLMKEFIGNRVGILLAVGLCAAHEAVEREVVGRRRSPGFEIVIAVGVVAGGLEVLFPIPVEPALMEWS